MYAKASSLDRSGRADIGQKRPVGPRSNTNAGSLRPRVRGRNANLEEEQSSEEESSHDGEEDGAELVEEGQESATSSP